MSSTLAKWTKQPGELLDYDVSFVDYLTARADTILSAVVTAEPGIIIENYSFSNGVVKVWLSGGTNRLSYKITVEVSTAGGREKHAEFTIQVKEV